jgi:hypothetical protein
VSDHRHESYEVYDLDGARQDAREALALASGLHEDLAAAEALIRDLAERIAALEKQTPRARQLQHEADLAAADLAASGYDRDPPVGADQHGPGCQCPYCYDPEDEIGDRS